MSTEQAYDGLSRLKRRYLLMRIFEIVLLSTGTIVLTYAFARLFTPPSTVCRSLSIVAGCVVFTARMIHHGLHRLNNDFFTRYLNMHYPQLKESADLLIRPENELTQLQQLQRAKTLQQFNALYPEIKLPNHIGQSIGIFAGCVIVYFALSAFAVSVSETSAKTSIMAKIEVKATNADTTSVFIKSLSVMLIPPSYTQLPPFSSHYANLTFPEGSKVLWRAEFSGEVSDVKIVFSGRDSVNLLHANRLTYAIDWVICESGFYQLQWETKNKTQRSDYYKIEVIKDLPPKVVINNPGQFTRLLLTDNLNIEVKSSLSDDYGLTNGQIIATVSKGNGESVKFREEKLRFSTPGKFSGKQVHAALILNLQKLGLEPGDELYFYVEVIDTKTPVANYSRTETFFIALHDTTTEIVTSDAGSGVDLLPEYFRSQRQIIIDTEKLLREKNKLVRSEFNATSNELGYDQKVLRLRYGQFMGEEADSGIGRQGSKAQDEDPTAAYSHKHDTENEHNLVDLKAGDGHDHKTDSKDPESKEDPMKDFIHSHDNTEEATFFIQTVKAKLKAALTLMWDSELHLRLYEPAKSLPYQYKILNLLKEIANDSRIYVHRTGFDPPPLKEEKRLTAGLTEIRSSTRQYNDVREETYPNIRKALILSENMLQAKAVNVTLEGQGIFSKAGQELSIIAVEQPVVYLRGLSLLKWLADQKIKPAEMELTLIEIRETLWKILPQQSSSPSRQNATRTRLDQLFLQSLDKVRHE